MARRSRRKRKAAKPNAVLAEGLPDLKQFVKWLDHTPEAKKDFDAFCKKHNLNPDYTHRPYKNYSGFRGVASANEDDLHQMMYGRHGGD